ncbi:response regulator [Haliscomenobacter sp.]|uniref:hybrid sensor histidine kinase/response regulator transcription factor n=1 Tax=Haliscomenobacter sp. TaxID=2717303 RepID=UPI003594523A
MRLNYSIFLSFGFILQIGSICAQPKYSAEVHVYTTEQGLPSNHVYQCFQDRRGLLWLLTGGGLCRFDGQEFKLVLDKGFNTDYSKNKILFEEPNGDLWISIYVAKDSVHYSIFNTITGRFSDPKRKFGKWLPPRMVEVVYAGKQSYWVSTASGELLKIRPGKSIQRINTKLGFAPKIYAADSIRQTVLVDVTTQENTRDQVCRLFNDRGKTIGTFTIPFLQRIQLDSKNNYRFNSLSQVGVISSDGRFSQESIARYLPNYVEQQAFDNAWPLAYDFKTQQYWLVHNYKMDVFHPQKGQFSLSQNRAQLLPQGAFSIFIDQQSTAWICTIEGLYQVKINQQRFQRLLWTDPSKGGNRVLMSCRGIVKDEKNEVLYASVGNCIWGIPNGQTSRKIFCREIAIYAMSMIADQSSVLAGCEALFSHDVRLNNTRKLLQIPRYFTIAWSFLTQGKRTWIGLNNGLAYWDSEAATFHFVDSLKSHPALSNAIIHSILPKDGQQLWLLSEKGLFLFDTQSGIIARYWTGGKGKYKLPVENLRACYFEKKDLWWFATAEGLLRWNPENGESRLFTTADGLSNNNLYAVYADAHGFLWMSSDKGIIQFQKSTGKTRVFLPQDGITHLEFNRISHHQDQDGRIYFGSLNGITAFHPDEFSEDFNRTPDIPLVLTSANLFSQKSNTLEDAEPGYVRASKIVFNPNHLYLTLRFALLDYTNIGLTQYEYLIEGLGNQWGPCSGGSLQLAGLPYGNFRLRVRAKTANGLYSSRELVIPIQVLRPFYIKWWFLLFLLSGIIAGIVAFFRYRNQWLKQRKVELEKEVAIQTEKILQDKAIIEEQAAELIKLDAAKSRFFANVTHELRTPITLILGPIHTYLEQNGLSQQDANLLYLAKNHTEGLQQMVNDLLDLSQLEAGKLATHEVPILLQQKIQFLLAPFEVMATNKGIELKLNYQADTQMVIQLDQRLFRMIFNNLLSNALKFTELGGSTTVRVKDLASSVQLEVEDSGRGIHPDDLPFVFDRYFQTQHQENAYEGGTGIGLALARESSKAMGGTLEVKSIWGKGSTFIFRFPKKEFFGKAAVPESLETHSTPAYVEKPSAATTKNSAGKAQLLLVEDNADLRQYLTQILSLDYQIVALSNGREAQEYLKNATPDLIISDIMMPLMDGFQLLEWLKAGALAQIPVIMLTARADLGDKLRALRIGVDDYLVKPFVEIELLTRIQNLLQRQDLRRSLAQMAEDEVSATTSTDTPNSTGESLSTTEKQWLELLEKTVSAHLDDLEFSVNDLAKAVFMSRSVFYNEMGRILGLTPNEYINEVRLIKAMELFQANPGVYSVKEMASKVGYRDEKYFSRQFKQRFGVLPSQLR